ncbi:MAG TPA: TAXI family TRAP transporter solute-binding subunit [Stellaceae bacterium]|nr:TAXI family TRAP transporter solute-binding subunit [Stellaceae bacterium]
MALVASTAIPPAPANAASGKIVLRAGTAGGESYRLALELAQTLAVAPKGRLVFSVAATGGAAANAADAAGRSGLIFISMPSAIREALHGEMAMPARHPSGGIRALFPLPFRAIHWIVRADSGVARLADLAGRPFIAGKNGSLGAIETAAALKLARLAEPVRAIADRGDAPALALEEAIGFAEAAAFPEPGLAALAERMTLRLLSLPHRDLGALLAADSDLVAMVIPAETYHGIDADATTVAMPVGVYATRDVSADEAYRLTKAFWDNKRALELRDPRWAAVTPEALSALGAKPHQGASRYYTANGVSLAPPWR